MKQTGDLQQLAFKIWKPNIFMCAPLTQNHQPQVDVPSWELLPSHRAVESQDRVRFDEYEVVTAGASRPSADWNDENKRMDCNKYQWLIFFLNMQSFLVCDSDLWWCSCWVLACDDVLRFVCGGVSRPRFWLKNTPVNIILYINLFNFYYTLCSFHTHVYSHDKGSLTNPGWRLRLLRALGGRPQPAADNNNNNNNNFIETRLQGTIGK